MIRAWKSCHGSNGLLQVSLPPTKSSHHDKRDGGKELTRRCQCGITGFKRQAPLETQALRPGSRMLRSAAAFPGSCRHAEAAAALCVSHGSRAAEEVTHPAVLCDVLRDTPPGFLETQPAGLLRAVSPGVLCVLGVSGCCCCWWLRGVWQRGFGAAGFASYCWGLAEVRSEKEKLAHRKDSESRALLQKVFLFRGWRCFPRSCQDSPALCALPEPMKRAKC